MKEELEERKGKGFAFHSHHAHRAIFEQCLIHEKRVSQKVSVKNCVVSCGMVSGSIEAQKIIRSLVDRDSWIAVINMISAIRALKYSAL